MKILNIVLIVLITLLSISAGLAKVMKSPQEVQFLQEFGFNYLSILLYGLIQILGGVLFALPKTIKWGTIVTILVFLFSSILILVIGNYLFFIVSRRARLKHISHAQVVTAYYLALR